MPRIAAIYLGDISRWNDPAIKKLNPKLSLPKLDIAPVYRSDGSGTNFLFTNYLSKVSPTFSQKIGANTSVQWPVGIGAKGNEGVANQTTQTSWRDRLRRVRLRQADRHDLRQAASIRTANTWRRKPRRSRPPQPMPIGPRRRATT